MDLHSLLRSADARFKATLTTALCAASVGLAFCTLLLSSAGAQESPAPADAAPADAEAAPQEDTDALARRIFSLGSRAYEEEHFADAAAYFERAYDLSGRGELMYNIGIARERQGEREIAVDWFERYLRTLPEGVRQEEVRVRLQVLRRTLAEEAARATAASASERAQSARGADSGGGSPIAGWALAGGGGALALGGIVLLVLAGSAASTVEDAPQGTFWVDVQGDADRATLFSALGAVGIGLGGAVAVGGLLWAVLVQAEGSGPSVAIGPTGVELKGSF